MKKIKNAPAIGISEDDRMVWEKWVRGEIDIPMPVAIRSKRSQDRPRTKLDLHGLTLQQAWNATRVFLGDHYMAGSREIVIVCGKGGQIAQELSTWCINTGLVASCRPIMDSRGEHGAYRITLRKKNERRS